MKRLFTFILLLPTIAIAQDTIRHLSGEIIVGKVIANKPHFVEFTYPKETSTNTVPKALLESIVYSSGRKEAISKIIDTNGESGWKNVMIAVEPDEVAGLVRVGEVKAKADNSFNLGDIRNADSRAMERLRKEAAMLGGHVVLLLQNDTKGNTNYKGATSFKSGIAYGYPFKAPNGMPYNGALARRYYGSDKGEIKKEPIENPIGKKALFENDGVVVEGVIQKQYGNFYKIKWKSDNGKEVTVERHISKVEVASDK